MNGDFASRFYRGQELAEAGEPVSAFSIFDGLVSERPSHRESRFNRGLMLAQLQRHDEAVRDYDWLVRNGCGALMPSVRFSRALSHLEVGNLEAGLPDFEYRQMEAHPPRLQWDGVASLDGKTVLVTGEGGYGDSIMFSRYLPMLRDRGAKVFVSVPPALHRLMGVIPGITPVSVARDLPVPDIQIRMMSLALVFGMVPPPLQFVAPQLSGPLKVGICWRGGTKSAGYELRCIPVEEFEPLISIPGIELHSLQVDATQEEVAILCRLNACPAAQGDFLDTAAIMAGLDAVVTADTSVAHLAASVGVPTLVMIPAFRAYWLWLTSPNLWYPRVRCFQQHRLGDWKTVVGDICRHLES